jgi:hypothetical protein
MAQTAAEVYMQEGRAEGVQEMRKALRRIIEARFGTLSDSLVEQITATSDLTTLREAICLAALVSTLEDFRL